MHFEMKIFAFLSLLGLSIGLPTPEFEQATLYYHENIGIQEAVRIKETETLEDVKKQNGGLEDAVKIVGGAAAQLGQYPHLGGLVITLTSGSTSVCGSSLLSNTRLVTAAHCWWDGRNQARQFTVVLGSTRLFSGGTRIPTSSVRVHEFWNPSNLNNDVAIIAISGVTYSNTIRNIALPSGSLASSTFVGATAVAAGFGRQRDNANIDNNQALHHVSLQVITNAVCQRTFGGIVISSTICTDGSQGRSTCGGDSGGPLQINSGGPVLIGITSFGSSSGCQRGFPAAFARVTSFAAWIRSRL